MRKLSRIDALSLVALATAVVVALAGRTKLYDRVTAFAASVLQERAIRREWNAVAAKATPAWYRHDSGPVIVEAFSYSCKGCLDAARSIRRIARDSVRLALLHLPPAGDSSAIALAAIAICASRTGNGAVVHDSLVASLLAGSAALIQDTSSRDGKSVPTPIAECVANDDEWRLIINEHRRLATKLRIRFTPFVFGSTGSTLPSDSGVVLLVRRERGAR